MATDVAWVSLVALAAGPGACDLCAVDEFERSHAVVVRHPRGGAVRFLACDRCAAAVRRLAAASGGRAHFALAEGAAPPPPAEVEVAVRVVPRPTEVAEAEVVHEFAEVIRDVHGTEYVIRACGRPREDGTWIGWLAFVAVGAARVLRTGQETTQPGREELAYWARDLESTYLEGAFARAKRPAPVGGT